MQNRPTLIPEVPSSAVLEATARSQVATSWQPAAVAMPWTRGGDAVDPGDHRLGQADDGHHHPAAGLEQRLVIGLFGPGAHLLEIVAGAERLAARGQYHDPDGRVDRDRVEGILERRQHGLGEGIVVVRPVQGQGADPTRILAQQDRLAARGGGRAGLI
jgi:hypothetical protein